MPSSQEIKARHDAVMFPNTANLYGDDAIALKEGLGCRVTDWDGKQYLDFFGGICTVNVGHRNERVDAAVKAQIDRIGHVSTLYPALPLVELAERLVKATPGKLEKVFFTTSGTEAVETAVTLAQRHTGRTEVVSIRHAYSGRSILGQALTAQAPWRSVPSQVAGVQHAVAPYCYRCPLGKTPDSCDVECAQDVRDVIETTTTGSIAAFIAEPVLGVGGFITPHDDYFKVVAEIVEQHGGLLIIDEVQAGYARTGKMWGFEHYGVEPDIVTMAKGIANGYPLSATLATAEVAASAAGKATISTFGGNPVSCAAGVAVLEEIDARRLVENAADRGAELREGLLHLKREFPRVIGDVRGRGLMQGIELVVDEAAGDRTPNPEALGRVLDEARQRGLLLGKGGLYGNVIRVSPPLTVSPSEVKQAVMALEESFSVT